MRQSLKREAVQLGRLETAHGDLGVDDWPGGQARAEVDPMWSTRMATSPSAARSSAPRLLKGPGHPGSWATT